MRQFSCFLAFGNRATFSLSFLGREVVSLDTDEVESPWQLDDELYALVPLITKWFLDNEHNISWSARSCFRAFISSNNMAEYPSTEVFRYLSEFALGINRV